QRRVEDLQLGVESYQKRLNLTKPDTYRTTLMRREAYTAYSNPRGFIYQNKDKKNRLMRIDELYKFSDGTLNDVRNALDDRLKGIRMQYLPTIIWRRGDKDKAAVMIQAIEKMLKTRRIMRSLEKFVGGQLDVGVESIFTTASSPIVSLQTPTPIMTPYTIATITTLSDAPIPPTIIPSIILKNLPTFNSAFRFDKRLRSLETTFFEYRQTNPFVDAVSAIPESVNATLEAEVLTRSSHSSRTSYAIAADLSKMELKKILIEKMEGNKSIQRSDEQRNLYKEGPSAGSDRGSKRRKEGGELASASTPSETATGSAGRSTTGESAFAEEPVQTTCQMEEPPHPTKAADYGHIKWIEDLVPCTMWIQEPINYDMHALWGVSHWGGNISSSMGSQLTGNLLSMYTPRGGSSLSPSSRLWNGMTISIWIGFRSIVIKRRVEDLQLGVESYQKRLNLTKPDTDRTLNDVCNALDDRLKGIWMQYLPTTIWRRGNKDRAAAMIQAIDKMLKTRRIMRSLKKFVGGRLSIDIQRRVEDLQLGVESYQKRLNLTKPDTYRTTLMRREAYTAYSNLRGFIYQNKDKKNRLMRIDELYKFSDGTLNDVRNALDDRLKGIRMQYLPTIIWRRGDKDKAAESLSHAGYPVKEILLKVESI
nr:hypothetical protein [Tanacetum cinerariifolium]